MRPPSHDLLDTIVALATPPGRSAIALVRLSGPDTVSLLGRVVAALPSPLEPRRSHLVDVVSLSGDPIDRGVLTYFAAPRSFTGEDVAEISVHGSPVIVARLLSELVRAGARAARAGEFTQRAFLAGKMDLSQAEAVRDLIEARTDAAANASLRRLGGELSGRLSGIRDVLLESAAALAGAIDFAEDVGGDLPAAARRRLEHAAGDLERIAATHAAGRLLSAGCRVAIVGPPNAGKSTLFNALAGSARAIVTDVPGTTRDALEASLDIGGVPMTVVDTAGLRETEDPVERIGVARSRQEAEAADAVLYVADASRDPDPEERALRDALPEKPFLIVENKTDLAACGPRGNVSLALCGLAPDAGDRLRALLERELVGGVLSDSASELVGSLRQRDAVARAAAAARSAARSLERGESPEYAAAGVNAAIDALGTFFGETTAEDVLDLVFSSFCIGK